MSRPMLYAITLALASAAQLWPAAAHAQRYEAAARLSPNPVARNDRFQVQAQLQPAGMPLPNDAKQADPVRTSEVASAPAGHRFRLVAAMQDKATQAVCGLDTLFQNGFE